MRTLSAPAPPPHRLNTDSIHRADRTFGEEDRSDQGQVRFDGAQSVMVRGTNPIFKIVSQASQRRARQLNLTGVIEV